MSVSKSWIGTSQQNDQRNEYTESCDLYRTNPTAYVGFYLLYWIHGNHSFSISKSLSISVVFFNMTQSGERTSIALLVWKSAKKNHQNSSALFAVHHLVSNCCVSLSVQIPDLLRLLLLSLSKKRNHTYKIFRDFRIMAVLPQELHWRSSSSSIPLSLVVLSSMDDCSFC